MNSAVLNPVMDIPVLQDGDRLDRTEFERRYEAMPGVKAELLDGAVYMASPATAFHASPHGDLMGWIVVYKSFTLGVYSGDNGTVRLLDDSEPQPDVQLRIEESCGGQSRIDDDNYVEGAPEWVGEVAYSSKTIDRRVKLPIYERAGILEYLIWNVEDAQIDWFILRDGRYERLQAGADGIIRSETFPGLWLDVEAMTRRDMGSVLRVLQKGIDSPEHAQFVSSLASRARKS